MASYGQKIEYGYDPTRDAIYPLFSEYFENPRMVKIKDVNRFSMYMVKIDAHLGIEFKYLIVFVPLNNLPVGNEKFLAQLEWTSLQTRTLPDEHDIPVHSYQPRRLVSLDKRIHLQKKDESQYIYKVDELPLQITLLPKTKHIDYGTQGSVVSAIETFQTLVNFVN